MPERKFEGTAIDSAQYDTGTAQNLTLRSIILRGVNLEKLE